VGGGLLDVHTQPARAPQKGLSAALECMYVIAVNVSPCSARSWSQASSTSSSDAMSAMEQPAFKSGRITVWCGCASTSADSAMKCTPQNTIHVAALCAAACCDSL